MYQNGNSREEIALNSRAVAGKCVGSGNYGPPYTSATCAEFLSLPQSVSDGRIEIKQTGVSLGRRIFLYMHICNPLPSAPEIKLHIWKSFKKTLVN